MLELAGNEFGKHINYFNRFFGLSYLQTSEKQLIQIGLSPKMKKAPVKELFYIKSNAT